MATADQVYADPSALLKLYLKEPESRAMTIWRAKIKGPLLVTHHGRLELINAIELAAHRELIGKPIAAAASAALDDDFAQGRYVLADLLWRATLERAAAFSREYTATIGCRTLDVLHVASAVELRVRYFLTFDRKQQELAKTVGLKLMIAG